MACLFLQIFTGWVNRFANAGDAAIEIAENTALRVSVLSLVHDCNNQLKISKLLKCGYCLMYLIVIRTVCLFQRPVEGVCLETL